MNSDGRVAIFQEVAAGLSAGAVGLAVDPEDDRGVTVRLTPEFAVEVRLDRAEDMAWVGEVITALMWVREETSRGRVVPLPLREGRSTSPDRGGGGG